MLNETLGDVCGQVYDYFVSIRNCPKLLRNVVPGAGVEPAQCFHRGILSPLRLPISPSGHG
jgi:hypothetical protein